MGASGRNVGCGGLGWPAKLDTQQPLKSEVFVSVFASPIATYVDAEFGNTGERIVIDLLTSHDNSIYVSRLRVRRFSPKSPGPSRTGQLRGGEAESHPGLQAGLSCLLGVRGRPPPPAQPPGSPGGGQPTPRLVVCPHLCRPEALKRRPRGGLDASLEVGGTTDPSSNPGAFFCWLQTEPTCNP